MSLSTPGPSLFGSQIQSLTREKAKEKNDTQLAIDDTLYELPQDTVFELGNGFIENFGVEAEDIFSAQKYH